MGGRGRVCQSVETCLAGCASGLATGQGTPSELHSPHSLLGLDMKNYDSALYLQGTF